MLKKTITYTDYNDQKVTETLYFNLNHSELIELEVGKGEGYGEFLKRIVAEEDRQKMFAEFKNLILLAYGEKSADGKRFDKTDEIRKNFASTAAYDAVFLEIITSEQEMANFINGLMPKEFIQSAQQVTASPPPTDPRDPAFAAMRAVESSRVIDVPLPPPPGA